MWTLLSGFRFVYVNKTSQSFGWSGLLNFIHSLMIMSYMSLVRIVIYLDIRIARNSNK
jgi:hypothetical protein